MIDACARRAPQIARRCVCNRHSIWAQALPLSGRSKSRQRQRISRARFARSNDLGLCGRRVSWDGYEHIAQAMGLWGTRHRADSA